MCDVDYGERCEVWNRTTPRARRQHTCVQCDRPIVPGEKYLRVGALYDGHWSTITAHITCDEIVRYIAFQVCGQSIYFLDGGDTDLRGNVREHMSHDPVVLTMYRDHLRQRNRAERCGR